MFFVLQRQLVTFLLSVRTLALRRIIPGTATLLNKDPIRALLYRHVILMIRDGTAMRETRVKAITQGVTKATDLSAGLRRCPPIGDRGRISPSSLGIIIPTRHVTHDNSRTIGIMAGYVFPPSQTLQSTLSKTNTIGTYKNCPSLERCLAEGVK